MITIKAPLSLSCVKPVSSLLSDGFAERITGNYEVMAAQIEAQDLLHMVTAPAEIYLAGQDASNVLTENNLVQLNQTKLDVVNNLLNRIAVTQEVDLTYQDRVYITQVMHQLGIKNVEEFMSKLSSLKEETNTLQNLNAVYWQNFTALRQTLKEVNEAEKKEGAEKSAEPERETYYLHEEIYDRLQTGAIYQILQNFYTTATRADFFLDSTELSFSEQERVVSQILLRQLREQTAGEPVPLVYRHENDYEVRQIGENQTDVTVDRQINSALLLHLADSIYMDIQKRQVDVTNAWIDVKDALYQTAENTLRRLALFAENSVEVTDISEYRSETIRQEKAEMTLLREMVNLREQNTEENLFSVRERIYGDREGQTEERLRLTFAQTERPEESKEKEAEDNQRIREREKDQSEQMAQVSKSYFSLLLEQRQKKQREKQPSENIPPQNPKVTQQERILRERERYVTAENIIQSQTETIEPSETYFLEPSVNEPEQEAQAESSARELEREVARIERQNAQTYEHYQQLLSEHTQSLEQVSPEKRQEQAREKTKKESLRALQNPQEVILEHRMREADTPKETEIVREVMQEMLPEETKEMLREVERMQRERVRARELGLPETDDMAQLIYDIHEVERENKERQEREDTEQKSAAAQTSEKVLDRRQENDVRVRETKRQERTFSDVDLVHRTAQSSLTQEDIAELLQENRQTQRQNVTQNQTVETINTVQTNVERQENNVQVNRRQEDVNELVRMGLQSQMGALSDQIYSRLEQRLERERKRRGY